MVKSTYLIASLTAVLSVVSAQEATPTAVSGITIPTSVPTNLSLPTDVANAVSSLINNPSDINSFISMASEKVSQIPSQYQSSAYSALSAASKSVAAIHPSKSAGGAPGSTSAANVNTTPGSLAAAALVITAFLACLL